MGWSRKRMEPMGWSRKRRERRRVEPFVGGNGTRKAEVEVGGTRKAEVEMGGTREVEVEVGGTHEVEVVERCMVGRSRSQEECGGSRT